MGIHSEWGRHFKRWSSPQPQREYINGDSITSSRIGRRSLNRYSNFILRQLRLRKQRDVYDNDSRRCLPIRTELPRTRDDQPNFNTKSHHHKIRHGHNKYVYPVIAALLSVQTLPARAEVGGVSATANPIANSSGSVTNQAIQVLQGPYVTNTYGGGVSCQGTTLNMTPYVQFADSRKDPWEDFYNEPQYNLTDVEGKTVKQTVTVKNYPWETWYDNRTKDDGTRWFPDGEDIQIEVDVPTADGVPDIVGSGGSMTPTWYKPIRTDMRANQSLNLGLSATLSIPLNRGMQRKCKEAAVAQINMQTQLTANKRLDFEIARLKNCGELKKAGIFFHPASPYHSVCADVVVTNPGGKIVPHTHNLPQPKFDSSSDSQSLSQPSSEPSPSSQNSSQKESVEVLSSPDTHSSSALPESDGKFVFPTFRLPFQSPSSQQASQPSGASQLGVLQVGQMTQQQTQ